MVSVVSTSLGLHVTTPEVPYQARVGCVEDSLLVSPQGHHPGTSRVQLLMEARPVHAGLAVSDGGAVSLVMALGQEKALVLLISAGKRALLVQLSLLGDLIEMP